MELGDAPDPPPESADDTTPLASPDESEGGSDDDGRASVEDPHGDVVMGHDGERAASTDDQLEAGDEPPQVSAGDDREDEFVARGDERAAPATGQLAAEGRSPPNSHYGIDRALQKCTQDPATRTALTNVHAAATSLLQPNGSMSDRWLSDATVKRSVVAEAVIPTLADVDGLMTSVRALDADHLIKSFVNAAIDDAYAKYHDSGPAQGAHALSAAHAATDASSSAPSTQ